MKKISTCYLDLDGVITDFRSAIIKVHHLEEQSLLWPKGVHDFFALSGMVATDFYRPLEHDFWLNLKMLPDSLHILGAVERKFGSKNVVILSAPTRNFGCLSGKAEWIWTNLYDYRHRYFIGAPKEKCAASDILLIDDTSKNTDAFIKRGGNAILVPRPWNNLHTVDDALAYINQELQNYERC